MLETPVVDLVGVASRTPEKAESFRAEFGLAHAYRSYEELIEDPTVEAVYIPLPNSLHAEWMIRAAESGKHCLCEKPFTINASEARRVAEVARARGVHMMEAFMWRLHSQHARAFEATQDGTIGPVRTLRAAFTFQLPRQPNVRWQPELGGGSMMDVGCYPVGAARFYFAQEPIRAYAAGDIDPEYGVDMRVGGVLEFPRGRALFDCAFDLPYRTEVEIVGESGTILIPKPWLPDPEAVLVVNGRSQKLPTENQYLKQFAYLSGCIRSGIPPLYGVDDAVRQMSVIEAILRSVSSGRPEMV
jgi:D-xylose 1-dehydrogenase (NADP+, D-xylono-1,5-lactone-forming)